MSMQTPSVGVLDITNATLRVGKLEVSSTQGIDSALNVFKANSILLFDDQRTSTTNPFTLSGSAIRNTGDFDSTSNIHLTGGSVYAGLGLPNAWSLEFDLYAPASMNTGNVEVEFYSTASTGGGGYKVTFVTDTDPNNVILSYDGTVLTSQNATIEHAAYRRVVIIYERGQITVSIGGTRVLYDKDIERSGPYTVGSAGFFRFAAPGAAVRRVRNIKISNDGPWSYTPTGEIAFLNGKVGVGTNNPTEALEVAGTVKSQNVVAAGESTFVDVVISGNLTVSGTTTTVDTQNIQVTDPIIELGKDNDGSPVVDLGIVMTRPESNVAIIYDESAKSLEIGYTLNGASDSTITMDTANVFDMNVHGNVTMSGTLTLGEFAVVPSYGLDHVTGENNSTSDTIVSTNVTTGFQASSNIVVGRDALISGNVVVSSNLEVGTANLFVDTLTGKVGVGTSTPTVALDVVGETKVSSNLEVGTANLFVDTFTGKVGVGTDAPAYDLDVHGTANVSDLTVTSNVNLLHTANTAAIKLNSNVVTEFPRSKKLIKYPRVAMTSASQDGYVVTASSTLSTGSPAHVPYTSFDESLDSFWHTQYPYYNATNGTYAPGQTALGYGTPANNTILPANELVSGHQGEWISLELPNKIKLDRLKVVGSTRLASGVTQFPKDVVVAVSNTGLSGSWSVLQTATLTSQNVSNHSDTINITTDASYYRYFALIVKSINSTNQYTATEIGQIELFGVPEYDPDAHGTDVVVKSIPNVPNTDWLEVYYDAKDLTDVPSPVLDLSGNQINGTLSASGGFENVNGVKAFTSSGSTTSALTATTTLSDSPSMSFSAWVKFDSFAPTSIIYLLGNVNLNNQMVWLGTQSNGSVWTLANGGAGAYNKYTSDIPTLNSWVHVTTTYSGGTYPEGLSLYVNGKLLNPTTVNGSGVSLTLPANSPLYIGFYYSAVEYFDGKIANFRLFNRALTSDEVWQLYAYQKEYFGHGDLGMTLKAGRLGIGTSEPRAALDVRGDIIGGCPVLFDCTASANTNSGSYVDWDLVKLNKGGGLNGTAFTAPVEGHYFFHMHGMGLWVFTGNEQRIVLEWHKNGVHYGITNHLDAQMYDGRNDVDADAHHMHVSGSIIAYLKIGDTIQVIVDSNSNTGMHGKYNRFTGHYIG